jgi:hypothetical protein
MQKRRKTSNNPDSGMLGIQNGVLYYRSPQSGSWNLPLKELAIIGEYTTDVGPVLDDWFLVFVHHSGSRWFECSMRATDTEAVVAALGDMLDIELKPGLANVTEYKSRILWPPPMKDAAIFTFSRKRGTFLLQKLWEWFAPRVDRTLSPDVIDFLKP